MKLLKQVAGIDVSKDSFHVCLGTVDADQNIRLLRQSSFPNNEKGFRLLLAWVDSHSVIVVTHYAMEATGVYYEDLAYHLSGKGVPVSVLVPNRAKNYARSLEIKTKTDKVDATILCRIGLERALPLWKIPSPGLKRLKLLCREHRSLKGDNAKLKSKLHAMNHSHEPDNGAISRLKRRQALFAILIDEVESEITKLIDNDAELSRLFLNIEQVKGLGRITIATVIAETDGFAAIENARQLASYAGMDVMMNQSGIYNGRTRISKKGNSHIRTALYLPAMSAIRSNERLRQFYTNIRERRNNGKVAIIAVARKMLLLIYTLWKNQSLYDPLMNVN